MTDGQFWKWFPGEDNDAPLMQWFQKLAAKASTSVLVKVAMDESSVVADFGDVSVVFLNPSSDEETVPEFCMSPQFGDEPFETRRQLVEFLESKNVKFSLANDAKITIHRECQELPHA